MRVRNIFLVLATVALTLGVTAASAAVVGTTSHAAGGQIGIQTATGDRDTSFETAAWTALPGATTTFTIPGTASALVNATFSSESACASVNATGWCSVRILIDRTEMFPQSGADFAFDTNSGYGWQSHSMQRSIVAGPGTHTVTVQACVCGTVLASNLRLDDWQLTTTQNTNVTR